MKSTTLNLLLLLMLPVLACAQKPTKDMDYKKYTGRYGGSEGICLFDDGRFLLYGYATAVFGDYIIAGDALLFSPDKMDRLEVYGYQNKSLKKGIRANFIGFERGGPTFLELGKSGWQRVFNENPNCFSGPFVYEAAVVPAQIGFFALARSTDEDAAKNGELWSFDNDATYNDFILVYHAPKREYEDFQGRILTREGQRFIQLSNYGGDKGYPLHPAEDSQWAEMLDWKKQAGGTGATGLNTAYANQHYRVFPELSLSNYKFDQKRNLYVKNSGNNNDEEYYSQNEYQDDRAIRKYVKLVPMKKEDKAALPKEQLPGSIFFSSCEDGSEKSYHYKGLKEQDVSGKTTKLDTIAPMVVPPPPVEGKKQ